MNRLASNFIVQQQFADRAQQLVNAWLRGLNEGGHTVTPGEIADAYRVALEDAKAGR